MNRFIFPTLFVFGLAAGCAGQSQQARPVAGELQSGKTAYPAAEATMASAEVFQPASALVFDLPVARGLPPLNLDRASREPTAFVGFEEPSVEYHTVFIDDVQGSNGYGWGNGYQREDVIQRTSVRYR